MGFEKASKNLQVQPPNSMRIAKDLSAFHLRYLAPHHQLHHQYHQLGCFFLPVLMRPDGGGGPLPIALNLTAFN